MPTEISWADETLNVAPGCRRKSPGCGMPVPGSDDPDDAGMCYAIRQAHMRASNPNPKIAAAYAGLTHRTADGRLDWTGKVNLLPERLGVALHWRKPRRIFVNSMGDLFNDEVTDEFLAQLFAVMASCPQHTFILLTKNHARMRSFLRDECRCGAGHAPGVHLKSAMDWASTPHSPTYIEGIAPGLYHRITWPLPNVWLGVSAEDQKWFDIRWSALRDTPAVVRWVSFEPLLGPINFAGYSPLPDWAVAGGESGPTARPMHPSWLRWLRDQCQQAGVAFHFKQWGEWAPAGVGLGMASSNVGREVLVGPPLDDMGQRQVMRRVGKKAAGRELDGIVWDEYPEVVS